jgi:cytochrome oxidase Cu insertion factor (SCO1/SenC/PrrC family)
VFVFAVFAVPVFRSVTRPLPAAPPVLGELPAFVLTDQQGRPVTAESLRGFVVLAEFVSAERFAEKPTTAASLVRRMRNTGGAVRIVSFVDAPPGTPPWCDAETARAARPRWIHASGGLAAFEAAARKASGLPDDLPLWGRLLLVDAQGRIRRVAVPLKPELDQLMRDTGLLVNMEGR